MTFIIRELVRERHLENGSCLGSTHDGIHHLGGFLRDWHFDDGSRLTVSHQYDCKLRIINRSLEHAEQIGNQFCHH
jgi:hypothetical protein